MGQQGGEMIESYTCPTCNHQDTIYTFTIGKGIVGALLKFKRATIELGRYDAIHKSRDLDGTPYELSKNESANWTMLRFHGLVAKDEAAGAGYWLLTRRGNDFIKGESVPAKVRVLNNEVLHDHEPDGQYYVTIEELLSDDSRPYYTEINDLERESVPLELAQTGFGFDLPAPRREVRDLG
jgi:hypothetical protein